MQFHFSLLHKRSPLSAFAALICTVMWGSAAYSQNFNVPVTKATGDLNKDGIEDLVTVTQDTISDTWPYRIQVSFGTGNGELKPVVSSDQLIDPQYPDGKGGWNYGHGFDSVEIKKGILIINNSLLRGHYEYKFRYQNGNFELIGYTYASSDGIGKIYSEDFNLSTGMRYYKEGSYETEEVFRDEKVKQLIRPLPRFQDIKPFDNDWQ